MVLHSTYTWILVRKLTFHLPDRWSWNPSWNVNPRSHHQQWQILWVLWTVYFCMLLYGVQEHPADFAFQLVQNESIQVYSHAASDLGDTRGISAPFKSTKQTQNKHDKFDKRLITILWFHTNLYKPCILHSGLKKSQVAHVSKILQVQKVQSQARRQPSRSLLNP